MNWRVFLRLGRVSNLPTVWTNCVAGVALAGGEPSQAALAVIVGVSLLYTAGMFLNDAFDHEYDRRNRPERPIPSGAISIRSVYMFGFVLLLSGLLVLSFRTEMLLWGVLLALLIVYYNYRHKADPLSPLIMALCRFMVYFVAAAAVASALSRQVFTGASVLAAYLIGLTYAAKQENLKEIKNLWPLLFLAAPFVYGLSVVGKSVETTLAYILLGVVVVYALGLLVLKNRRNIPRAVVTLIAGISLLDGVVAATASVAGPWTWLCIAGFAATICLQRFIPGT